jgi:hypothetical protein
MKSYYHQLALALLLSVMLAGQQASAQQLDQAQIVVSLRAKYPYESIYLTNTTLNDLTVHLRDPQKFKELSAVVPSKTLNTLRKFLESNTTSRAFLQIDIVNLRAGFKRSSERLGTISPLAWTKEDVANIAGFVDQYLNGQIAVEKLAMELQGGNIQVAAAWSTLDRLTKDPFVPAVSLSASLKDFSSLVEKKQSELAALKKTDLGKYQQIANFTTEFKTVQSQTTIDTNRLVATPYVFDFNHTEAKNLWSAYSKSKGMFEQNVSDQTDALHGLRLRQFREATNWEFGSKKAVNQ